MNPRFGASTLLCLLLQLSLSAVATPLFGPYDNPGEPGDPAGKITFTEIGKKGDPTFIFPTNNGDLIPSRNPGNFFGQDGMLNDPVPGNLKEGSHTFTWPSKLNGKKVNDFRQQTGDPAVLQASAFTAGVMVDSLWDWLLLNGYDASNPIFQPDFFLVGGGDVYFAVDLAALGAAGKAFVDTWALGSIFAINASGRLDDMPFYMFSSTLFGYTEGSGWTGGTPLAAGTKVSFDAFHAISIPEPGTLVLMATGLAGFWFGRMRKMA